MLDFEDRGVFIACTPYQLFVSMALVSQFSNDSSFESTHVRNDLVVIGDYFSDQQIDLLSKTNLFNQIYHIAGRAPVKHDFIPFLEGVFSTNKRLLARLLTRTSRLPDCQYGRMYYGSPVFEVHEFRRLFCTDSANYAIDDGTGSHCGTVYAGFSNFDFILSKKYSMNLKERMILLCRFIFDAISMGAYRLNPRKLYLVDPSESDIENYRNIPIESVDFTAMLENPESMAVFPSMNDSIYQDASMIYFGSSGLLEDFDAKFAPKILKKAPGKSVFRAHPKSSSSVDLPNGVLIDDSASFWEPLCIRQPVGDNSILVGIYSTAQVTPYAITGSEPFLIFLYKLVRCGSIREAAFDKAVLDLKKRYTSPDKVIVPETERDLMEVLDSLNCL